MWLKLSKKLYFLLKNVFFAEYIQIFEALNVLLVIKCALIILQILKIYSLHLILKI